jgi:parallel beta-helix repeat protein
MEKLLKKLFLRGVIKMKMNTRYSKHFWLGLLVGLRMVFVCLVIFCVVASGSTFADNYVVNSLEDSDDGGEYQSNSKNTLRKCIRLVNRNALPDNIINFSVFGTINITSDLPAITVSGTVIDASTQWSGTWPGGAPGVTIKGDNSGNSLWGLKIIGASNCAIRGLFITGFFISGIYIESSFIIETDSIIEVGAKNNVIGGIEIGQRNVISGNTLGYGIEIFVPDLGYPGTRTGNNSIIGNYIGTETDGNTALSNSIGVYIYGGTQNIIGGTTDSERNVISGNGHGVFIFTSDNNQVKGNYIGTKANGTAPLGNLMGITICASSQNVIEGNVISGNSGSGIWTYSGSNSNQIKGNYIGTNYGGTFALGNGYGDNGGSGVDIASDQNNLIERNVISGNSGAGITIGQSVFGDRATGNQIRGNYIGTNATGNALGNQRGVEIVCGQNNVIGGATEDAGNIIAYNSLNGVMVGGLDIAPKFNTISHNSIHDNGELGILLFAGGNDEIPAPDAKYVLVGNNLSIAGSGAGAGATVEIFKADSLASAEGMVYLGSLTAGLTGDENGKFSGYINVAGKGLSETDAFVMTTTHTDGNTSEFKLLHISYIVGYIVDSLGNTDDGLEYTQGDGTNTLRKCIRLVNTYDLADTITFGKFGTINIDSQLPNINVSGTVIDANSQWSGTWPGGSPGVTINVGKSATSGLVIEDAVNCRVSGLFVTGFGSGIIIEKGSGNVIGGIEVRERNVISGNSNSGIVITDSDSNQVIGNYIGIGADGASALGNQSGVSIGGGQNNVIERNVISGNKGDGIGLDYDSNSNQVKGNYIGTSFNGTVALGNSNSGVGIYGGQYNVIGGATEDAGNIIAYNGFVGIQVGSGATANFNTISHNSIHDNGGLGIWLVHDGNNEIPAPIAKYSLVGDNLSITGSGAGKDATVEVFKADSFESAEGMLYLGSLTAIESGNFSGDISITGKGISETDAFVMTTTHTDGNTSAFQLLHPSHYIVDSLGDTDDGLGYKQGDLTNTLRKCIRLVNTNAISDTIINFGVSGTIDATSDLPELTVSGTVIDASSRWIHPLGAPGVILNGKDTVSNGLTINGVSHCKIVGLFIRFFRSHGIIIKNGARENVIGGIATGERNVISGNIFGSGIEISNPGTDNNRVIGNYIGTSADGNSLIGNADGVVISDNAQNNIIGGITDGERNVISGNAYYSGSGIYISSSNNNQVKGNYIGTNANGIAAIRNGDGVVIGNNAQNNIIGGTTDGERNVISGNENHGIYIDGSNNNQVKGNYIGTNADGNSALGNKEYGIEIYNEAQNNIIGGTTDGERNVISGNENHGIYIHGSNNNQVKGNYIGTNADGTSALKNSGDGVRIFGANNIIGGTTENAGNKIAYNGGTGVKIEYASSLYNTISHNSIHDNGGLGIDLVNHGNDEILAPYATVTLNDNSVPPSVSINVILAGANATVEVFKADSTTSAEGMLYLGSLTADGLGRFSATYNIPGKGVSKTDALVLTTTHTDGNTSECRLASNTSKVTGSRYKIKTVAMDTINQGQTSSPYTLSNNKVQNIVFGLDWEGSTLKLKVYKPDGSLFDEKEGPPPLIIEVSNAEVGDWQYTVEGIDVPNDDYPYAVMVGEGQEVPTNISLKSGWNMISFPGTLSNPSIPSLLPSGSKIVTPFYTWNPQIYTYDSVDNANLGEGYWALALADEIMTANVTPVNKLTIHLKAGWNMIGSVSGNVAISNPNDNPDNSIVTPIYWYNPTICDYDSSNTVEQNKGYWALALNDCDLTLDSTVTASPSKIDPYEISKPDWMATLKVITSRETKELSLGVKTGASDGFDPYMDIALPPRVAVDSLSSESSFVIEDRLVSRLSRDVKSESKTVSWKMELDNQNEDIELTWDSPSLPIDRELVLNTVK